MKKLATLLVAALAGVTLVSADVLDFQNLEVVGIDAYDVGSVIVEDGWSITKDPGEPFNFYVWGTLAPFYPGSTALFNNTINGVNRLQHGGASNFDVTSIDLDYLNGGSATTTVSFTGYIFGGGTVVQSFETDAVTGLQTFNFVGFDNLTSMEWIQDGNFHQYDNIVLNVVPEPGTIVVLIAGISLVVARRRR